jgi:hypothetical protein
MYPFYFFWQQTKQCIPKNENLQQSIEINYLFYKMPVIFLDIYLKLNCFSFLFTNINITANYPFSHLPEIINFFFNNIQFETLTPKSIKKHFEHLINVISKKFFYEYLSQSLSAILTKLQIIFLQYLLKTFFINIIPILIINISYSNSTFTSQSILLLEAPHSLCCDILSNVSQR